MRLHQQVAIVTGAGRGIGKAIAIEFAQQGAQVIALERDTQAAKDLAQALPAHRVMCVDVMQRGLMDEIVKNAVCELGGVGILVNNAVSLYRASCACLY